MAPTARDTDIHQYSSSSSPNAVALIIPEARQGWLLRLSLLRASWYQTISNAVVTEAELAAPGASTQHKHDHVYIRLSLEKMMPVERVHRDVAAIGFPAVWYGGDRTEFEGSDASCRGRLAVPGVSAIIEVKVLMYSGSGIAANLEELVDPLQI